MAELHELPVPALEAADADVDARTVVVTGVAQGLPPNGYGAAQRARSADAFGVTRSRVISKKFTLFVGVAPLLSVTVAVAGKA